MRKIVRTSAFKTDLKRLARGGRFDVQELFDLVLQLAEDKPLAEKHTDHALTGRWKGVRDCHIRPDWLLLYSKGEGTLVLVRTGSHAELFG